MGTFSCFPSSVGGHEMNPEVTLSLASLSAPQLYSLRGKRRLAFRPAHYQLLSSYGKERSLRELL